MALKTQEDNKEPLNPNPGGDPNVPADNALAEAVRHARVRLQRCAP